MPLPRSRRDEGFCLPPCDVVAECGGMPLRLGTQGLPGALDLGTFHQELAAVRLQLAQLLQGQAEIQSAVLKIQGGMSALHDSVSCLAEPGPVRRSTLAVSREVAPPESFAAAVLAEAVQGRKPALATAPTGFLDPDADIVHSAQVSDWREELKEATPQDMLRALFITAEEVEAAAEEDYRQMTQEFLRWAWEKLRTASKDQLNFWLDTAMAVLIVANAIYTGLSVDDSDGSFGWIFFDYFFSVAFMVELVVKCIMNGPVNHFCGPHGRMNLFDSSIILVDIVQLMLEHIDSVGAQLKDTPGASVLRIVRLVKLVRLLRLLRTDIFSDLVSMISGMSGGLSTLFWALVLYVLVVYVIALIFREFFGSDPAMEYAFDYFNSVPRSMMTTFRCSFGDCTTWDGYSLIENVADNFGAFFALLLCVFVFCMFVGIFNVVSAIFVQSTLEAASQLEKNKKMVRLRDTDLWALCITTLIRCIMAAAPDLTVPSRMSESVQEVLEVDVPCSVIDEAVKTQVAVHALDMLDIDPDDHENLSDILDPDNTGKVSVTELVEGLRRLRGQPRRSDIVSVDLMVRSIQGKIASLEEGLVEIHKAVVR